MVQALTGNQAAYRELLTQLSGHLRAWYRKHAGRVRADIEDLVQEALIAIHNQRHTYDPSRPLTAWAYAIARYKLVDALRRHGRGDAQWVPLETAGELFAVSDEAANDARRDLHALLARLPDRQRLPIQHVKVDGLSVAQAARLTGMSIPAVKVGIHRGLKALAARLRQAQEEH